MGVSECHGQDVAVPRSRPQHDGAGPFLALSAAIPQVGLFPLAGNGRAAAYQLGEERHLGVHARLLRCRGQGKLETSQVAR